MNFELHLFFEEEIDNKWEEIPIVNQKIYSGLFKTFPEIYASFWVNYCNYHKSPYLSEAKGLPNDLGYVTQQKLKELIEPHHLSWVSQLDLVSYNYELIRVESRSSAKSFLGPKYFDDLRVFLEHPNHTRIILAIEG